MGSLWARQYDSINREIPLTSCISTLLQMGPVKSDPNKQLIPLTVIPLSGAHGSLSCYSTFKSENI